eukprot:GHVH01003993.1.p1 GENE.GHVH01003993.1~~GHVH01003993.1.p1  ORF type:complete len:439 (+),score=34.80 GHVH01003993.1:418-1734(+)
MRKILDTDSCQCEGYRLGSSCEQIEPEKPNAVLSQYYVVVQVWPVDAKYIVKDTHIYSNGVPFDVALEVALTVERPHAIPTTSTCTTSLKEQIGRRLGLVNDSTKEVVSSELEVEVDDVLAHIAANESPPEETRKIALSISEQVMLSNILLSSPKLHKVHDIIELSVNCAIRVSGIHGFGFIHPRLTRFKYDTDDCGIFSKIHIVPFEDTIPTAYEEFDPMEVIRPYVRSNPWLKYIPGDTFWCSGIQFKVIYTEDFPVHDRFYDSSDVPQRQDERTENKTPRKIGSETLIYTEGQVAPHWVDILPRRRVEAIRRQPARIQSVLLLHELQEMNPTELQRFFHSSDLPQSAIESKYSEKWEALQSKYGLLLTAEEAVKLGQYNALTDDADDLQCMICLDGHEIGIELFVCPCYHAFHMNCARHWFTRESSCPLCRHPVE